MYTSFGISVMPRRQLSKSPGFSLTVMLTLALGIGATTAIFSLVEAILLRPLPFARPDRLVMLGEHIGGSPRTAVTARDIGSYSRQSSAFSSLGGFATFTYELSGTETPEQIEAGRFNASVFHAGRHSSLDAFTAGGGRASTGRGISYRVWLNRFHRDPQVLDVGALDRKAFRRGACRAVLSFRWGAARASHQLWVPLSFTPKPWSACGNFRYQMVARLKEGVTIRHG